MAFRTFLRFSHAKVTPACCRLSRTTCSCPCSPSSFRLRPRRFDWGARNFCRHGDQGVSNAFPGLIGEQGVSPETLAQVGQTTSALGLLVLLYSSSGAMVALSNSMHLIWRSQGSAQLREGPHDCSRGCCC